MVAQDIKNNKFDIAMAGFSKTLERQYHGVFSDTYFIEGKSFVTRCKDVEKYNSLSKIDQKEFVL